MNKTKTRDPMKSTFLEKLLYGFQGCAPSSFCYLIVTSFLTMYYTNSVGISAAVVGTMMLIARFFDGITDVIMGAIMEKTHVKMGKTRFWMLISAPLLAIGTFFMLHVPQDASESGKIVYTYITYFFVSAVSYTVYNIADGAMPSRIAPDPKDQGTMMAIKQIFLYASGTLSYVIMTNILTGADGNMASEQGPWSTVALICTFACSIPVVIGALGVREKITDATDVSGSVVKTPLKVAIKACATTREFWVLLVVFFFSYVCTSITSASGLYYFGYVLQDWNLISLSSTGTLVVEIVALILTPIVLRKLDRMKVIKICALLSAICGLVPLIDLSSSWLMLIGGWLKMAFFMPVVTTMWTLISDVIVHIAQTKGIRCEGFVSMSSSIGIKLGTGIGAALVGWILAWGNYDGMAQVQPQSAITAIIIMAVVLPSVCLLAESIMLLFWRIGGKNKKKAID